MSRPSSRVQSNGTPVAPRAVPNPAALGLEQDAIGNGAVGLVAGHVGAGRETIAS